MPPCRSLGMYEVRSNLPSNRIPRIIFCIHDRRMVLLHGFIKKNQKTPLRDLDLALTRTTKLEDRNESRLPPYRFHSR
jgi:phage-related protein